MTTASERPVARMTTPAEMVGLIPYLCGFVPAESLVVVSLRGPRKQVGLTLRFDLDAWSGVDVAAADVAARMSLDEARETLVVVYTEQPGDLPREELVQALDNALAEQAIVVQDALLVRAGRWHSYRCRNLRCCPAEGTPLQDAPPSAALTLVAATGAFEGRVVQRDRDDLTATLAPPEFLAAEAAGQRLDRSRDRWERDVADRGPAAVGVAARVAWRRAIDNRRASAVDLDPEQASDLVVALLDVDVRDAVLCWAADDADELLAVLYRLAATTVAPYDVAVCTLLAITSWVRGDGAVANVALDRALAGDPSYNLALLVRTALAGQVPPATVRQWLRGEAPGRGPKRATKRSTRRR